KASVRRAPSKFVPDIVLMGVRQSGSTAKVAMPVSGFMPCRPSLIRQTRKLSEDKLPLIEHNGRIWPIATDDTLTANRRFRGIGEVDRFDSRTYRKRTPRGARGGAPGGSPQNAGGGGAAQLPAGSMPLPGGRPARRTAAGSSRRRLSLSRLATGQRPRN